MGSKRTEAQLREVTDYQRYESFCNDLMARCGYQNIQPFGGFKDKGRDAIHVNKQDGLITIFFYSVRQDWAKKLKEDLEKIRDHGHSCDEVVYVTNQNLSASDIDRIKADVLKTYGWPLDIFGLARIAIEVDLHQELKQFHPEIFYLEGDASQVKVVEPLNYIAYADKMMQAFERWQQRYTPLLANYIEFDLYAVNLDPERTRAVSVLDLPNFSPVVALLGESGAGKTTTLWKLLVEASKRLKTNSNGQVPIYVELRNWSDNVQMRNLVQNKFAGLRVSEEAIESELIAGNCLILVDGLNELPASGELRDKAGRDIRNFYKKYPDNKFLFTCRTADYDPELIHVLDDSYPPSFETQRLTQEQVAEYVNRYFQTDLNKATGFLANLALDDERKWNNNTSFVHLVRIPIYLQMTLAEYETSGVIPDNKGTMLRNFVFRLISHDKNYQVSKMAVDEKVEILSSLALAGIESGYFMTLPKDLIRQVIKAEIRNLYKQGAIPQRVAASHVLLEVLSTNFLVIKRGDDPNRVSISWSLAEWLHQVVHDYFLAVKVTRTLVSPRTDKALALCSLMAATPQVFDQPCQMSLGLLNLDDGRRLYTTLVRSSTDLAKSVLEGLPEEQAEDLVLYALTNLTDELAWDQQKVATISLYLPSVFVVNRLARTFKMNSTSEERRTLANTLAEIAIRFQNTRVAKTALDVCEAWVANKDDEVSFYAAKALWGRDRGRATATFKRLMDNGSPNVRARVQQLITEWRIR